MSDYLVRNRASGLGSRTEEREERWMRIRLNPVLLNVLAMRVQFRHWEELFCVGSLSNLTWYISGKRLKTFPFEQFLINGCGPREVCRNSTFFSPYKNFACVCKEQYVVYSNN